MDWKLRQSGGGDRSTALGRAVVGSTGEQEYRFLSALMNAIVFARVFGTLVYFGYGSVSMSVTTTPSTTAPAQTQK
jgi:hypothetical protein